MIEGNSIMLGEIDILEESASKPWILFFFLFLFLSLSLSFLLSLYLSTYLSIYLSIPLSLSFSTLSWWHAIVFWLVCRLSKGDQSPPPQCGMTFRERENNLPSSEEGDHLRFNRDFSLGLTRFLAFEIAQQ